MSFKLSRYVRGRTYEPHSWPKTVVIPQVGYWCKTRESHTKEEYNTPFLSVGVNETTQHLGEKSESELTLYFRILNHFINGNMLPKTAFMKHSDR